MDSALVSTSASVPRYPYARTKEVGGNVEARLHGAVGRELRLHGRHLRRQAGRGDCADADGGVAHGRLARVDALRYGGARQAAVASGVGRAVAAPVGAASTSLVGAHGGDTVGLQEAPGLILEAACGGTPYTSRR
jgi:hypothetical protein